MKGFKSIIIMAFYCLFFFALHAEVNKAFTVNTLSKDKTVINFKIPEYSVTQLSGYSSTYSKIVCEGSEKTTNEGLPEIPFFTVTIAVPVNSNVVLGSQDIVAEQELNNLKIFPMQDNEDNKNLKVDNEFYNRNNNYPASRVVVSNVQTIRDYNIVNINVYPFTVNSRDNKVSICKEINFTINHDANQNTYQNYSKISRAFEPFYESFIANYEQIRSDYPDYQKPSLLIIQPTNNDAAFTASVNSLVNWKKQKGFIVNVASAVQTGNTTTSIKAYIQNAYNTWEDRPEYLMIIGDVSGTGFGVPTYNEAYGFLSSVPGAGDYPYTLLSAEDYLGDVIIGRLSVSTVNHLQTMVSKILLYEKNPTTAGIEWFHENLLVGDTDPSGYSCVTTNKYVKEVLENYDSEHNYLELYGSSPSSTQMLNKLSSGILFFNYRGWIGMSGFTPNMATSATNIKKLTNAVFITCSTGAFSSTTMTEEITRAGTPAEPKGAITAIGMSTSHTLTPFNNVLTGGIFHALFKENITTMGGAMLYAKHYIHRVYASSNLDAARTFSQWMNLMGDPSLNAYRSVPKRLYLTYPDSITVGLNYLPVVVKNANNEPIKNAWVSLTDSNNNSIGYIVTNETGTANISLSGYTSGTLNLVVTHPDYSATIKTIQACSTATVALNSFTISDTPIGNNDNQVNPGEQIILTTTIKNNLSTPVSNLNLTLKTNNPYVIINDSTATIVSLNAGSLVNLTDEFKFTVLTGYPCNKPLELYLKISDTTREWISFINPKVYTADLDVIEIAFPGNTPYIPVNTQVNICYRIINNGSTVANNVSAILRSEDSSLTIIDSLGTYGSINAGATVVNNVDYFTVQILPGIYPGESLKAKLIFSNTDSYYECEDILIKAANPLNTDPLAPDNYGYIILDQADIQYEDAPVYNWIDVSSTGTTLALADAGNNQDKVVPVTLPFNFRVYGQAYSQISVCSNGWFAPGITEQANFRNLPLPGPLAPAGIIAPFWNDLIKTSTTNSGVFTKFNETEHYFVIQWNNMKNYSNNQTVTFEAILYDPTYYANSLGDSPIKFQYNLFNAGAQNDGSDPETPSNYFTTGIQNQNASTGLTYAYNNIYSPGATALSNGKALLLTSKSSLVSTHFHKVWSGDPILPIHFNITNAFVDGTPLSIGDEIAIFDNQYCVGTAKVDTLIFNGTDIIVSADNTNTTITDGYSNTHTVSYKIWKSQTQTEYSGNCMQVHYSAGNNLFNYGDTNSLLINAAVISTQNITLSAGWNKISSSIIPPNTDLMTIFSNLISTNTLQKIQNESGLSIESLPTIGWINSIGNFSNTEGYLVKVNTNTSLALTGYSIFPPLNIPLRAGWNIISYPYNHPVNAMTVFQSLINAGVLVKVTDPLGNSLEQLPNPQSWINNINNLQSGMAYSVCVTADTSITFEYVPNNTQLAYTPDNLIIPDLHFNKIWSGNGYQHMNFHFLNPQLNNNPLNAGDEIAVFDGERCVASGVVQDDNNYIFMNASMDDGMDSVPNGFVQGNPYQIKLFINSTQQELSDIHYQLLSGSETFISGNSAVLNISHSVSNDENNLPKVTSLYGNYPNPFNPSTTISFSLKEESNVCIEIYNIKGQLVRTLINQKMGSGKYSMVWEGKDSANKNVSSGVYFYRMKTDRYTSHKKMLLMK